MKTFPSTNTHLVYHGRTHKDNSGVHLVSSAASVKFRVKGTKGKVWMKNAAPSGEYNYISWVIDGHHFQRQVMRFGEMTPVEIPLTSNAAFHDVEIYKETEAANGSIIIGSIEAQDLLEIPAQQKKKIEFIGNSITAGMASDPSVIPCMAGRPYDQHNAYQAYGPVAARKLDLDYVITAVTGIGVYRNWATDVPVMSNVYEKTFLTTHPDDPMWNFISFVPDIVCINLGTNDLSDGDGMHPRLPFDSTRFVEKYVELIKIIHGYYPVAQIVLLQHPMSGAHHMSMMTGCLEATKKEAESKIHGLKKITIFSFSPHIPTGCSGHPGLKEHALMAEELAPVLSKLI